MKRRPLPTTAPASSSSSTVGEPDELDLSAYLRDELLRRCRSNPRYSLRAFARFLKVDPSQLSRIMRGDRVVGPKVAARLAERLGPEAGLLLHRSGSGKPPEYRQLTLDNFRVISDWHHYAILELTKVRGFRADPAWIGTRLGVPRGEIDEAVARLRRLGMLETGKGGKWVDRSGAVTTVGNEFTAEAFRRLQRQVLEMGVDAMEKLPLAVRDQSSMTMAIDSRRIPAAKARIRKFRRELCAFLQKGGRADGVYQLGVCLYPVALAAGPAMQDVAREAREGMR